MLILFFFLFNQGINHELDKEVTSLKSDLQSLRQKFEISRKAHEKETKELEIRVSYYIN